MQALHYNINVYEWSLQYIVSQLATKYNINEPALLSSTPCAGTIKGPSPIP